MVEWSQRNLGDVTSAVSDFVLIYLLDPLETLFVGVPWWMMAGAFALIGWRVSGGRLAVGSFLCIAALGVLGMWDLVDGHARAGARGGGRSRCVFAIPLGIFAARATRSSASRSPCSTRCRRCRRSSTWCRCCFLVEPGRVPAIIASFIYALPVGIRLTNLGIRQVPEGDRRGRQVVRVDARTSCSARCSCRSRDRRSCSA